MAKKAVSTKKEKTTSTEQESPKSEVQEVAAVPVFNKVEPFSLLTDYDISLFRSGKHYRLYEKLGSHVVQNQGTTGTLFAVWAPNAKYVSVIGTFNGWNRGEHPLNPRWDGSGIWEGWIPNIGNGEVYKYFIASNTGADIEKGDPYALRWEHPPKTASIVWDTWYEWKDQEWMKTRRAKNALNAPCTLRERNGLYARRVYANHGASV
jgi:1,4-alpha-glucan branching enzyme